MDTRMVAPQTSNLATSSLGPNGSYAYSEVQHMTYQTKDHSTTTLVPDLGPKLKGRGVRKRTRTLQQKAEKSMKTQAAQLDAFIEDVAMCKCLQLCAEVRKKLPPELRILVYGNLIGDANMTFYSEQNGSTSFTNGTSADWHFFKSQYTGPEIHTEVIQELCKNKAMLDLRGRHARLGEVLQYYNDEYKLDLAPLIRHISFSISKTHLKRREEMFRNLQPIFSLPKNLHITVVVHAQGNTENQVKHAFKHILIATIDFLTRLKDEGYKIRLTLNPKCSDAPLKDGSRGHISILSEESHRYVFTDNDTAFTLAGLMGKLATLLTDRPMFES